MSRCQCNLLCLGIAAHCMLYVGSNTSQFCSQDFIMNKFKSCLKMFKNCGIFSPLFPQGTIVIGHQSVTCDLCPEVPDW